MKFKYTTKLTRLQRAAGDIRGIDGIHRGYRIIHVNGNGEVFVYPFTDKGSQVCLKLNKTFDKYSTVVIVRDWFNSVKAELFGMYSFERKQP